MLPATGVLSADHLAKSVCLDRRALMNRDRALKVLLVLVGLLFFAGVYPLVTSLWRMDDSPGEQMMLSVYVTLGVFVLLSARNPWANRSLIAFTAWSSFAHAAVMAVLAFQIPRERRELLIAVAGLVIIGAALIVLAPAEPSSERTSAVGA
jgi:uncharacterized membrane protein HdeD (DUF308 family)